MPSTAPPPRDTPPTRPPPGDLTRFPAVCERLGFCLNTGYKLRDRGDFPIPTTRIGFRYYCFTEDVEAYFSRRTMDRLAAEEVRAS